MTNKLVRGRHVCLFPLYLYPLYLDGNYLPLPFESGRSDPQGDAEDKTLKPKLYVVTLGGKHFHCRHYGQGEGEESRKKE